MIRPEFVAVAIAAFESAGVPNLLLARSAIVLERIARAAGNTRWYYLEEPGDLELLAGLVSPSSTVSFYFDGRIAETTLDAPARARLSIIAERDHGSLIALRGEGIELDRDFPRTRSELDDWLREMGNPERGFIGPVPGRDNDGIDAITLTLPDPDGVIRPHPH